MTDGLIRYFYEERTQNTKLRQILNKITYLHRHKVHTNTSKFFQKKWDYRVLINGYIKDL